MRFAHGEPGGPPSCSGRGVLGATQVGMARALAERGMRPALVLKTSIGAPKGGFVAPTNGDLASAQRLAVDAAATSE